MLVEVMQTFYNINIVILGNSTGIDGKVLYRHIILYLFLVQINNV